MKRVLPQRSIESAHGVVEIGLIDDVIALEDGSGLVARQLHSDAFGHVGSTANMPAKRVIIEFPTTATVVIAGLSAVSESVPLSLEFERPSCLRADTCNLRCPSDV